VQQEKRVDAGVANSWGPFVKNVPAADDVVNSARHTRPVRGVSIKLRVAEASAQKSISDAVTSAGDLQVKKKPSIRSFNTRAEKSVRKKRNSADPVIRRRDAGETRGLCTIVPRVKWREES